jgi:uncharacterized protein (UPF0333 family)
MPTGKAKEERMVGSIILRKAGMLVMAVGLIATTGVVASSPALAVTYYRILNYSSGDCIQQSGSGAESVACSASSSQYWALQSTTQSGYYKLVNKASGKCIGYVSNFDGVSVSACTQGADDQKWEEQPVTQLGYDKLVNLGSGECIDDYTNGAIITLACAQGNGDQYWELI